MKRYITIAAILSATLAFVSCDEWEPVFTTKYDTPELYTPTDVKANTTIKDLKAKYKNSPVTFDYGSNVIIGGRIISEDRTGNIYRSLYIQDETGAIEVKIGKSALYNDYKRGQMLYVNCDNLTLGRYNGMLQIGVKDPSGSYETAYIDADYLINTHIFRGDPSDIVIADPLVVSEADIKAASSKGEQSELYGKYVTLKGLKYANEIFVLLYIDSNQDTKQSKNRIFLSESQWGINTWAMSKSKYLEYLKSGIWDSAKVGNSSDQNYGTVADHKAQLIKNASAYSVSQYFTMAGGTEIQVRTSGYSRFSDTEIEKDILDGTPIDITGIITNYNGSAQFTLIDLGGVVKQQ